MKTGGRSRCWWRRGRPCLEWSLLCHQKRRDFNSFFSYLLYFNLPKPFSGVLKFSYSLLSFSYHSPTLFVCSLLFWWGIHTFRFFGFGQRQSCNASHTHYIRPTFAEFLSYDRIFICKKSGNSTNSRPNRNNIVNNRHYYNFQYLLLLLLIA